MSVLETSDLPAGVVNIVTGAKDALAKVLAEHDDVEGVWFCGSAAGARAVEEAAAANMKRTWVATGRAGRDWLDPHRVVLRGFSMGGAGTWHLGLHRPDRWAVIGPGAGFTTTHGYVKDLPEKLPAHIEDCLHIYDAVEYATNAFNVPVVAYAGGTHWAYFQADCKGPVFAYYYPDHTDVNSVGPTEPDDLRDSRFQVRPERDKCNPCLLSTPHRSMNAAFARRLRLLQSPGTMF